MKTLSVGVVSLFLELAAVEACACDCVRPPSPQARFDEAKVVFSGRVRETIRAPMPGRTPIYRFQVQQIFKGPAQTELVLEHGESNCAFSFHDGDSYLVFAYGKPAALTANICSATQKLTGASEEIKALHGILAKGTGLVAAPNGYFQRDEATGRVYLKANEFNMPGPITFAVREVWRFDPPQARWRQEPFTPPAPKRVVRGIRQAYGSASDASITPITDQIGLFWIKWAENETPYEGFAFSGMSCQDIHMTPPPTGFVAACIPYANRAQAAYVPDPRIHCVAPSSRRPE